MKCKNCGNDDVLANYSINFCVPVNDDQIIPNIQDMIVDGYIDSGDIVINYLECMDCGWVY